MAKFERSEFLFWEGDFAWDGLHDEELVDPRPEMPDSTGSKNRQPGGMGYLKLALGMGLVSVAGSIGGTAAVIHFDPMPNRPTFEAVKLDGCYVSTDKQWVRTENGIYDLIVRNVQGVTDDIGKGSECLRAAIILTETWANSDGNPNNDIVGLDLADPDGAGDPIIDTYQQYPVPQFATLKPQG